MHWTHLWLEFGNLSTLVNFGGTLWPKICDAECFAGTFDMNQLNVRISIEASGFNRYSLFSDILDQKVIYELEADH